MSIPQKNINVYAPLGLTGYGITSVNIIKGLNQIQDLQVNIFPIGQQMHVNDDNEKKILEKGLTNARFPNSSAPCLKIWHQYDLSSRIGDGHYYAFPFFEVDQLKDFETHQLNNCHGVFVASKWAKRILINNGVTVPIYVAPLAVDTTVFKTPAKIRTSAPYTFFNIGKWEVRKAHDFLLQAFDNAFTEHDNVELRLLPSNPFLSQEENQQWMNLVGRCKLKDKIKILPRLATQHDVAAFIFDGDCGIYPSRAEGWNNEILETMALNRPIITTNYSAHTEYCTKDNSYLIDIDELEVANDGKWFNGFGKWAKLGQKQFEQTIQHMRYVYNNNIRTNEAGLETCKSFTWSNTANIIHQSLMKNNSYYANSTKKTKRR